MDRLTKTLTALEVLTPDQRWDAFLQWQVDGTAMVLVPARPDEADTWGRDAFELRMHGVVAQGGDRAEALRNWMRAAHGQASAAAQAADALDAARALVNGERAAPMAEMVAACRLVRDHAAVVSVLDAARAIGTLTALSQAHGCPVDDLHKVTPPIRHTLYRVEAA